MNKKTLAIIIVAGIITLLTVGLHKNVFPAANEYLGIKPEVAIPPLWKSINSGDDQEISLTINDGENSITSQDAVSSTTAYELLKGEIERHNKNMEVEEYSFGVLVVSIDGLSNSSEKAWIYFVNGEAADVAADQKEVGPGDHVEWKYIEPIY